MKKGLTVLLSVSMLALAACSSGTASTTETTDSSDETAAVSSSSDRLDSIIAKGYIEVTTEPYFAPYEFIDPTKSGDEQYVGYDIEIANYIADKIGVDLKIVPLDFTAVLAGIVDGKYDMAISAIAYSPTRAESMTLSNVYQVSEDGYGFIVREEDADVYTTLESLADATVITQDASVQQAIFNSSGATCKEMKLVANMTDAYLAVAEGKADVCICSTTSAGLYAEANGGLVVTDYRFEVDENMNGVVVAMPKDDCDSLLEVVNEAIAELRESGQIDEWEAEYTEYAKSLGLD